MKKLLIFLAIIFCASLAQAVTFQWDASQDADGYTLYYYKTSDSATIYNSAAIAGLTYELSPRRLERNEEYTFYVTAYNAEGESGPSNSLTYTRDDPPYQPPNGNEPQIIDLPQNVTITIQIGQ